jgi:hypothetical protein
VIDDQEFAGPIGWLEFQTELLYSAKDRQGGRVRLHEMSHISARKEPGCSPVDPKFEVDIKLPGDPGPIDNWAI